MDKPNLNIQQKQAVEAPDKPLLIVAGAGTGKTRTLTSRIIHLINKGTDASSICALTFTNKAAKEMLQRVEDAGLLNYKKPFIGTFHSLGSRILRAEAKELKRNINFTIFDDGDSLSLMKKVVKELDMKKCKPAELLKMSSFKKSGASQGIRIGTKDEEIALEHYERFLMRNNAFDFDDLIQKVVWLFRNKPLILSKYQNKFKYVLVDEYQDVSPAQYSLVRLLAQNHRNISVVGDDSQMIYGWRYATIQTFLRFEEDWPSANVVSLEENYRSTSTIINAASAVIEQNKVARQKKLWTNNSAGRQIQLTETTDEEDEAECIAQEINDEPRENRTNQTTAILYRTNAQSRALEQALLKRGIPYKIYGGLKFYERREIKDIVAALRLIANPQDEISHERLQKAFGIRSMRIIKPALLERKIANPTEAIELFMQTSSYLEYLERETMNPEERLDNIKELIQFSKSFENISSFLEHVALVQAADDVNAERKGNSLIENKSVIHLSTVHIAKGLEFNKVFLAGCSEGILPHARSLEKNDELEEERRLMYVAMTRAREKLNISFYGIPSRFIGEIPEQYITYLKSPTCNLLRESDEETVSYE